MGQYDIMSYIAPDWFAVIWIVLNMSFLQMSTFCFSFKAEFVQF